MRIQRSILSLCLAGAIVGSLAGCRILGKSEHADRAISPQEKAHRDQLTSMGQEDADSIEGTSKPRRTRAKTIGDRRSGQRKIDQPRG